MGQGQIRAIDTSGCELLITIALLKLTILNAQTPIIRCTIVIIV